MDLGKQVCLLGRKSKLNSWSKSAETTHVFWKSFKFKPRTLNVKKTRCSSAPNMRSEALCEEITSGDVPGSVAFWFVKSLLTWEQLYFTGCSLIAFGGLRYCGIKLFSCRISVIDIF